MVTVEKGIIAEMVSVPLRAYHDCIGRLSFMIHLGAIVT